MLARSLVFSSVLALPVLSSGFALARDCIHQREVIYLQHGIYYPAGEYSCSSFAGAEPYLDYGFFMVPDSGMALRFYDVDAARDWFAARAERVSEAERAAAATAEERAGASTPSSFVPDVRVEVFSASVVQLGMLSLNLWPPYRVMRWGRRLLKIAPNVPRAKVGRLPYDHLPDREHDR